MTNSNGSEQLDRMQSLLEETIKITQANSRGLAETRQAIAETRSAIEKVNQTAETALKIAESNGRTMQAMLEQRATEQLKHEERMRSQAEFNKSVARIQEGLGKMLDSLDSDRPTILRKLTTIENKLDSLSTIETKLDRIIQEK